MTVHIHITKTFARVTERQHQRIRNQRGFRKTVPSREIILVIQGPPLQRTYSYKRTKPRPPHQLYRNTTSPLPSNNCQQPNNPPFSPYACLLLFLLPLHCKIALNLHLSYIAVKIFSLPYFSTTSNNTKYLCYSRVLTKLYLVFPVFT